MNRILLSCVTLAFLVASSAANAVTVGTYGSVNPGQLPAPHTGDALTLADIEAGVINSYDVFWIGHAAFNAGQWSQQACDQVEQFLANGGGVVTEWNAVTMLFESLDPSIYAPMVGPQCGFFTGS
ncbi:MAG: hypothetical protein KJO92_12215, partial [Gammaproteobacteria bacterium]|nr:hypothetical protein [Gammaproteobacteria bacterium]